MLSLRIARRVFPFALALSFLSCKQLIEKLDKKSEEAKPAAVTSAPSTAPVPAAPEAAKASTLGNFEGTFVVQMKSAGEKKPTPPVTASVKGTKFRFEIPEGEHLPPGVAGAHAIVGAAEKKLWIVVQSKKQVVVVDFDKAADQMKSMAPPKTPAERDPAPANVRKTGEKATLAGLYCEDWEITTAKGDKSKICVAEESASFFSVPNVSLPLEHGWAKELFDGKHFPLRFIGFDDKGTETTRVELVRLERKSLDDSLFTIPSDYEVLDLGAFIQNVMAGAFGAGPLGAASATPSGLPPGVQLPPNLPPEVKKQIEAMRAKAAAQQNTRSR